MSHHLGTPRPSPPTTASSAPTPPAMAGGVLVPEAAHAAGGSGSGVEAPDWPDGPGRPDRPQQADATLQRILADIDPARIRHTIETLVGFGTRHTLSTQTDPRRGIGAARDWIFAELQGYAAASGGRMTVEIQGYTQDVGT